MTEKQIKEHCQAEFVQIEQVMLEIIKLRRPKKRPFNKVELAALGTFLHNFYNGAENILKQISAHEGFKIPSGPNWHKDLLKTALLNRIINKNLMTDLLPYLAFRHFFVHGYGFDLDWQKMKSIVNNADKVYLRFKSAVTAYISK